MVEYISPAEMLHFCDICNYPGESHDAAAIWPCAYLLRKWRRREAARLWHAYRPIKRW